MALVNQIGECAVASSRSGVSRQAAVVERRVGNAARVILRQGDKPIEQLPQGDLGVVALDNLPGRGDDVVLIQSTYCFAPGFAFGDRDARLLHAEDGIGPTITPARYDRELLQKGITLCCRLSWGYRSDVLWVHPTAKVLMHWQVRPSGEVLAPSDFAQHRCNSKVEVQITRLDGSRRLEHLVFSSNSNLVPPV